MKILYCLPLAAFIACSSPKSDTSNQAVAEQKASDNSLKAVIDQMPDVESAVEAFTDVKKTLFLLDNMGTGQMRPWRSNELRYMSSSRITSSGMWARSDSLRIVFTVAGCLSA